MSAIIGWSSPFDKLRTKGNTEPIIGGKNENTKKMYACFGGTYFDLCD